MKGINIYLADDDLDDVGFFKEAVKQVCPSCSLTTSKNGKEMIDSMLSAKKFLPQIVFLDINMPVMNGLECLKIIRANPRFNSVPVIMLTTSSSQIAVEVAYKLGANLFIKKPMDFKDLKNIIRLVISADWTRQRYPAELSGAAYCISFPA